MTSFDFTTINGNYYIYCAEQIGPSNYQISANLIAFTISLNDFNPATTVYATDNCGTYIKVTTNFVVLSCPSNQNNMGLISVYTRSGMQLIQEVQGSMDGAQLGQELQINEDSTGQQIYIYYTVGQQSQAQPTSVNMLEILLDSADSNSYLIIDPVDITVPIPTNLDYG